MAIHGRPSRPLLRQGPFQLHRAVGRVPQRGGSFVPQRGSRASTGQGGSPPCPQIRVPTPFPPVYRGGWRGPLPQGSAQAVSPASPSLLAEWVRLSERVKWQSISGSPRLRRVSADGTVPRWADPTIGK